MSSTTEARWVSVLHEEWEKIAPEPLYADPTDLASWFDAAYAMLEGEHWNHYDDEPAAFGMKEILEDEAARRVAAAFCLLNYGGLWQAVPYSDEGKRDLL